MVDNNMTLPSIRSISSSQPIELTLPNLQEDHTMNADHKTMDVDDKENTINQHESHPIFNRNTTSNSNRVTIGPHPVFAVPPPHVIISETPRNRFTGGTKRLVHVNTDVESAATNRQYNLLEHKENMVSIDWKAIRLEKDKFERGQKQVNLMESMENFDMTHSIPWSRGNKKHEVEIRVIKTSNSIKGHHMGVVDWEKVRNISKSFIVEQKK
eukprot:272904_1